MTVEISYYVTFGPGDSSEWQDWEEELTPEEEAAYLQARKQGLDFNDVPELADVLSRAYDQIYELEKENCEELFLDEDEHFSSGGWSLEVFFPDNDYDEEEDEEEAEEEDDEEIVWEDYMDYPFAVEVWNYEILSFKASCKEKVLQVLQTKTGLSRAELADYLARLYEEDEDEDEEEGEEFEHLDILDQPGTDFWEDVFGFSFEEKAFKLDDTGFLDSRFGSEACELLEALEISTDENINPGPHGHGTNGVIFIEDSEN